jgi:hypothetical protein
MENSAYMESITASRALLLDEDEQLAGMTCIGLETQQELTEEDILTYIIENFAEFLRFLRFLKKEDQELLLSYYLLSKTQNTLAIIHKSTQTVCSFRIRMAVKTLACFIMLGSPTQEKMKEILTGAKLEDSLPSVSLSEVVDVYARLRSFQRIAEIYHLHRPDIRRAMSRASKQLMDSKDAKEHALGAFVHSLIDKASPTGVGFSKRKQQKLGHIYRVDPPLLGEFRIRLEDPDFDSMFVSRANR